MLRLPLLIGARPAPSRKGGVVRLSPGKWRLVLENHIDSELHVVCSTPDEGTIVRIPPEAEIDGDCEVYASFVILGRESFVNVFAEKIA
jgi:hypothetical protein